MQLSLSRQQAHIEHVIVEILQQRHVFIGGVVDEMLGVLPPQLVVLVVIVDDVRVHVIAQAALQEIDIS